MPAARASKLVLWLLLGVLALIVYGSLYPFHFKPASIHGGLLHALEQLSWARAGKGDRISNVLLYLPLGFCLFLSLNRRYGRRISVLLATVLGAAASLAMEVAQVYVSVRVPSLTDLSLNTVGTLIGAAAGIAWGTIGGWMHFPGRVEKPVADPSAALLVILWLAWRFAPFVPHLDLGKLKAALRPLFDPQFDAMTTFVYLAYWLIVSEAIAALVSKPRMLEALLVMIASVLVGRLIVANQTLVAAELLALVILLPLLVLTIRLSPRPKRGLLLSVLLIAFAIDRLAPFQFSTTATFELPAVLTSLQTSGWHGIADVIAAIDVVGLFGRLFLYGALTWTLRETGVPMRVAATAMVCLVLLTELLQAWLIGASASLADPVVAILVAATFNYVHEQRRDQASLAPANSRHGRIR